MSESLPCTLSAAALAAALAVSSVAAQAKKTGNPERDLPPNIVHLTGFGERASWSPDDTRVAFMSKSFGDAFEIDLGTREKERVSCSRSLSPLLAKRGALVIPSERT